MMQTSIGAHNHRSCRANFRGKSMGEYDQNVLDILTIPEIFSGSMDTGPPIIRRMIIISIGILVSSMIMANQAN